MLRLVIATMESGVGFIQYKRQCRTAITKTDKQPDVICGFGEIFL